MTRDEGRELLQARADELLSTAERLRALHKPMAAERYEDQARGIAEAIRVFALVSDVEGAA